MAQKYFLYSFVHFVHICSADSVCYQTLYLSSLMTFFGNGPTVVFSKLGSFLSYNSASVNASQTNQLGE